MLLFEGGNIWPDVETNFDPGKVGKPLTQQTQKYLNKLGATLHTVGSCWKPRLDKQGNVVPSNDLDAMIDLQELQNVFGTADAKTTRQALDQYLQKQGLETHKAGVTVHTRIPLGDKFYQVDIKVVPKAEKVSQFHRHEIPQGSQYKGVNKQLVMNALASSQQMLWSPDEGLYARDQNGKKAQLLSDDWDTIAKYLLGKTATGRDLGSVESIMAKIPDPKRREEIMNMARAGHSWQQATPGVIEEATKPDVGRKYQHVEDLVLSHGSHGAMHAIERLKDMGSKGGSIELKWDGMPVVYWGRDEDGTFRMIPKNAWQYLKSGKTQTSSGAPTVMNGPNDVKKFILGTGSSDSSERKAFANQFASLWPYFEKISPKQGYLEGGLLFYPGTKPDGQSAMPVLNKQTNTYDFKPNITTFHVPVDSDLGKRIAKSKLMVAATGYYPSLGSSDEQRLPNAESLSVPGIIVQGTTYVQDQAPIDMQQLANLEAFIKKNAKLIDSYLSPKTGLSKPGGELYTYLNQHLRTEGLLKDFPEWAKQNLSQKKAVAMLSDTQGLKATLGAVEGITNVKEQMIQQLQQGLHGGIKQTKPEGYAQAHPGSKFKYDIPGQFIKTISQKTWSPKESVMNEARGNKTAVVGWGRGMGHTGHMYLADAVITQAKEMGADPYFFVSKTIGKDDPIYPDEKIKIYQRVFPQYAKIFSPQGNLNDALTDLEQRGYENVVVVVGADQKNSFKYLENPNKQGVPVYKSMGLKNLKVISRQETNSKFAKEEGPRATPMREILMNPNVTEQDKFSVWRRDMPKALSDKEVLDLMHKAEERMKTLPTKTKKLKEFIQRVRPMLKEANAAQKLKVLKFIKESLVNEFAPGNGDDSLPYAEYVVYQCDPNDQFQFIGKPLYQTDSLSMAHKYAYEHFLRYRPKAFVVYQPHKEASRGNYGVKGESDDEQVNEGFDNYISNAIYDLGHSKQGLDRETFLDELYFYLDAEYGKQVADRAFAHEDDNQFDDWYDQYQSMNQGVAEGTVYNTDPNQLIDVVYNPSKVGKQVQPVKVGTIPYKNLDKLIDLMVKKHKISPTEIIWNISKLKESVEKVDYLEEK